LIFSPTRQVSERQKAVADARIEVRLRPRSRADELEGFEGDVLQARVTSAPVDGKANRALCRLIAKRLGVAPSRVSLLRGDRSRHKLVVVEGIDPDAARARLGGPNG
jgi:uncharacterized protein